MSKIKIIAVCGFGVGSSLVLKMQLDEALSAYSQYFESEACDVTSACGPDKELVFTSPALASTIESNVNCPVIVVEDFLNMEVLKEKAIPALEQVLQNKGIQI